MNACMSLQSYVDQKLVIDHLELKVLTMKLVDNQTFVIRCPIR